MEPNYGALRDVHRLIPDQWPDLKITLRVMIGADLPTAGAIPHDVGTKYFFAIIGILDAHLPENWFRRAFERDLNQNDVWVFLLARHFVDNGLLVVHG